MHKVEKHPDGGWVTAVEYRVHTIDCYGDSFDMAAFDTLADALASAQRQAAEIAAESIRGVAFAVVAVVVERATYTVATRAEARRLVARTGGDPDTLEIDYYTEAVYGDPDALAAGGWAAAASVDE